MPRPSFTPTAEDRRLVECLAAVGIRQADIARRIGIRSPKTLRKHFRTELDLAAIDANANVARSLYKKAIDGDVAAQTFWLERRAGWRVIPLFARTASPPPFIVSLAGGVTP
jgi:hypothetical protein